MADAPFVQVCGASIKLEPFRPATIVASFSTDSLRMSSVATVLARWYAEHASIRRLSAIDGDGRLTIFLSLEPTFDGDDALPIWLAHEQTWSTSLRALTGQEVRLRLVASGEPRHESGVAAVAEIYWRESWLAE